MKHLLTIAIALYFTLPIIAQHVTIDEKPMSAGIHSAYIVMIENSDEKTVQKEWQTFLKEYSGKSKRDRKSQEVRTTRAAIGGIGGSVNVFATSSSIGSRIKHMAWFESGGEFVSPTSDESASNVAIELMERFILHMKRVNIMNELELEEKTLSSMQKELQKEEKNESKQHSIIEKAERQIEEAKVEIVESKQRQEEQAIDIEKQQMVIEAVKVKFENVSLDSPVDENDDDTDEEEESID